MKHHLNRKEALNIQTDGLRRKWGLPLILFVAMASCHPKDSSLKKLGEISEFNLNAVSVLKKQNFKKKDLMGRVWIASFILTSCNGPCPVLSGNMEKLQTDLPESIGLLSFTVDPDFDSADVLQRYAKRFHAQANRWFFVFGKKEALYQLYEEGFKISAGQDKSLPVAERFVHTTKFVLLDQSGQIRGYYDGDQIFGLSLLKKDALKLLEGKN